MLIVFLFCLMVFAIGVIATIIINNLFKDI